MVVTPPPLSTNISLSSPNKRKHKALKIKTEDYHDRIAKKHRISNTSKAAKTTTTLSMMSMTTMSMMTITKTTMMSMTMIALETMK